METTWLLALGVVLLVLVVGLSVRQRLATRPPERTAPVETPPPGAATPRRVRGELLLDDPRLGVLEFNNDALWRGTSLDFGGVDICVHVPGSPTGPAASAHALALRAVELAIDLTERGRAMVAEELRRRGRAAEELRPYELAVEAADGKVVGYLWYEVEMFDGEIGVSSADGWQTLAVQIVE